jgi:hypothetical protein
MGKFQSVTDSTSETMEVGDWSAVIVKAIIVRPGVYHLYRCFPFQQFDGVDNPPQGQRIYPPSAEREVSEALFPVTLHGMEPDEL